MSGRFMIGTVGISAVDMAQALREIDRQLLARRPAYVCVANVRTTVLSQKDRSYCKIQNESLLTLPDGMPLVWYARLAGLRTVSRVTGPDLMLRMLGLSGRRGYSHYFLGDTPETLSKMAAVIRRRFPNAVIKGLRSPPFRQMTAAETDEILAEINDLQPSFVWVGLGAPKQEFWMADVARGVKSSILVGVGAAFRFLIGDYTHPPEIIQIFGLEGLWWRFREGPLQLARRYCKLVPSYAWLVAKMLGLRVMGVPPGKAALDKT